MAIKSYPYNSNEKLSEHFKVSEFRCKCGKTHIIKIDTVLVDKLEKLYAEFNCSKITVVSGYRCVAHDKAVGGTGKGQHTLGRAVDVRLYDKDGKIINTKYVSCVAQDLGFRGIANINKTYTNIHLDNRANGKYYGNEPVSKNTVTTDFYKYYGISKAEIDSMTTSGTSTDTTWKSSTGQSGPNPDLSKWPNTRDPKIKELQKILNDKGASLVVDGYAGKKTYSAVIKYTISYKDKDQGPLTKWTEARLKQMGIACGTVDGIADVMTSAGIGLLEMMYGLEVDKIISKTDWYYLLTM